MTRLLLPATRVERWCGNVAVRHGELTTSVEDGALVLRAVDGTVAELRLPWDAAYDGAADPAAFARAAGLPVRWGLLLVRKGGFAVARGTTATPEATKVGRRHVQGRSKAGGWSQQRFARRRDNQAKAAFEAAADHAHRVLGQARVDVLVGGGDRSAVDQVLADPRLAAYAGRLARRWLAVGEPSAQVLATAVADAWSVAVEIDEPDQGAAAITRDSGTNE